jgi:hypothetical protein
VERDTARRNVIACFLLVLSVLLSDVGLPFVVAAAIAVGLGRRPARLWIPAIPLVLFAIWWLAYGSEAPTYLSVSNLEGLPTYVFDSASSGLASIAGVNRGDLTGTSARGHVLLIVAAVVVVAWLVRGGRPSSWLLVFVGAALTFWVLTGANYTLGRAASASRYQLVDATLLILIAAELFRSTRLRRWQVAVLSALALIAIVSNLDTLGYGYRFMRHHATYTKADLGALQIARRVASPRFQLFESIAHDPYLTGITAKRYFSESAAHGSPPAYSPKQIANAPPAQRQAADNVLTAAYGVFPTKADRPSSSQGCRRLAVRADGGGPDVQIPPRGAFLTDLGRSPLVIYLRRFAPKNLSVSIGFLGAGSTARIAVPPDSLALPWKLTATGRSALEICPR